MHFNTFLKFKNLFADGDFVKFNLPQAAAVTLLAWGGVTYSEGYTSAGELSNLRKAVKWGTDYFIKCHVSNDVYYAQVDKLYPLFTRAQTNYSPFPTH